MNAHQKIGIDRAAGIGSDFSLFFAGYADHFLYENRQSCAEDEEIDNAVIVELIKLPNHDRHRRGSDHGEAGDPVSTGSDQVFVSLEGQLMADVIPPEKFLGHGPGDQGKQQ